MAAQEGLQTDDAIGDERPGSISAVDLTVRSNGIGTEMNGTKVANGEHATNGIHPPEQTKEAASTTVDIPEEAGKEEKKKKDDKEAETPQVGILELLKYSDGWDVLLMVIGTLAGIAHGIALPYMIIVFGDMLDSFLDVDTLCRNCTQQNLLQPYNNRTGTTHDCDILTADQSFYSEKLTPFFKNEFNQTLPDVFADLQNSLLDDVGDYAIQYVVIGCIVLVAAYLQTAFWNMAAKRQAHRIRLLFFRAVLRQDIGWFDTNPQGELNTRLTDDVDKVEAGIGDKLVMVFMILAQTIACVVIGFVNSWKLTLVILASSPLLVLAAGLMDKVGKDSTEGEQKAYASAGAVAEEVISSIRTVVAFGGQDKECTRYSVKLSDAKRFGIRKGLMAGISMGAVMLIMFLCYALGFWYGATLIVADEISPGRMLIVFFSILIAAFGMGQAGPSAQALATSRGAAHYVFRLIEREPPINCESSEGTVPPTAIGNVTFENVHFQYPSRPDVKVLQGLNLKVASGKTVALVGSSGCGKSTTVQLIQRFYDIAEGKVCFDGVDIRELNVKWLRSKIGIVSQEPSLFATTIAENIRYGRDGVTDEEIIAAAKAANAHDFISRLPGKYKTLVGSRGAQLSGGQKQRIAIARALVNTPKVLLLDEATSALDTESEASVQEALEKASAGRTTIVIAHRLTTVQNADLIVALKDGRVAEQGTHPELMELDGIYANLVRNQIRKEENPDDDEEEELEKEAELIRTMSQRGETVSRKRTTSTQESVPGKKLERLMSTTSHGEKDMGEEDEEKQKVDVPKVGFCELLSWNGPEWYMIVIGCFFSLITGGSQPAFAVVFSKLLSTFMSCYDNRITTNANFWALMFVAIAFAIFFSEIIQRFMFAISGERLTERIRAKAFRAYLRQDVSYFDDPDNSTGAVTTRLATEASAVQGSTGSTLGALFNAIANLGTGIIIAFVFCWELTLAILGFVPFLGLAGFIEMKILKGGSTKNKKLYEQSGKIAVESIDNIRTVQGLSKGPMFYEKYLHESDSPYRTELRMSQFVGITYSVSQGIIFFAYAALFYLGAYLISIQRINFEEMMITFSAVVFGAMSLGQLAAFGPSFSKGAEAAGHIKKLEETIPSIDAYSKEGEDLTDGYQATVEFKDIEFSYPTRPGVKVLNSLSVSVDPGQTLALVGSSGCGKSTTVQLVERFYDTHSGAVIMGGKDVRELNVDWLRRQVGLVSQEPTLFDRSIADNIRYGANHREATIEEVIEAAKMSNIHDFISNLPEGYDTRVGDKGTQLSGGQKQRVAIARALLRNPKILLLDEATSALDSESEKVVQEALDAARRGRTSIVIAHRLSTIQNADKIAVIRHGHVSEIGTHAELMSHKGFYFKLQSIQQA